MENELEAELTLSGPLPHREVLATLLPDLAADALNRTMGQRGEGSLSQWTLEGTTLTLTLETTGARPHQTLLALARRLSEELGRRERVGVRSFRARRYRVTFSVATPPAHPVALPLPHHLSFEGDRATLELTDLGEDALRDNWMDRAIALVQEKVRRQSYEGKEQYWALLSQSPARTHPFDRDPTEEMLRRNWVRNGPTKGKWFLGPIAALVLRTMDRIAREEVLGPLGFVEVVQPHHDSFDILLKTGHLEGLPGEFYYVAEPRTRDPAEWPARFREYAGPLPRDITFL